MQAVPRPLPGASDADRAGEFSFGRLVGGPTSSRFSAIVVVLSGWLLLKLINMIMTGK